jgi:glycosyltransferase involved in cell wall biosynthesis
MKILHLTTSLGGGAGIAARRIHEAELDSGIDSEILTLADRKKSNSYYEGALLTGNRASAYISSALTILQRSIVQNSLNLVTPYSLNIAGNLINAIKKFDVIHIHATYNLVNYATIKKLLDSNINIVVTMHDMRFFTGACHQSGSCAGFQKSCENCPQVRAPFRNSVSRNFERNIFLFTKYQNLKIVSPSEWLAGLAQTSSLLERQNIYVVRNPIPSEYNLRNRSRLPGPLRIGFIATNFQNPNKGFGDLTNALNLLAKTAFDFELILIGQGDVTDLDPKIARKIRITRTDSEMSMELNGMDWLMVPSRQDNCPNVIGEALMTGTKVLGSLAGGVPEISTQTVDVTNPEKFADRIRNLDKNHDRQSVAKFASKNFSFKPIAQQYIKVYQSY